MVFASILFNHLQVLRFQTMLFLPERAQRIHQAVLSWTLKLDAMKIKRTPVPAYLGACQSMLVAGSFALSSLLAAPAWGLSLGHAHIESKQGEPLRGYIEILSASSEELEGLKARLYSQTDYKALELTWENTLASTELKIAQATGGKLRIGIEGREPVENSFVELFFDLHWNSGQVNKQVGLLLDPATPLVPKDARQDLMDRYVLVHQGDTASELIKPYLPSDVSLDQMLLALVQSNPKSFVNGNVNRMLAGSSLQIPKGESAKRLSVQTAQSLVAEQNEAFNTYRKSVSAKVKNSKALQPKSNKQASGLVHDPKKDKGSGKDQLTLNKSPSGHLETLSKERQDKEQAQKLKEIQDNIKELQVLSQADKSPWWSKVWSTLLQSTSDQWQASSAWVYAQFPALQNYTNWPLAPVITGLVFAAFVLLSLWRIQKSRQSNTSDHVTEPHQDVPGWRDSDPPSMNAPSFDDSFGRPFETTSSFKPTHISASEHMANQREHAAQTSKETSPVDDRVKLAEDLWDIGQHHTAYAIAQEVLQQSSGKEFDRAKKWLENHAI